MTLDNNPGAVERALRWARQILHHATPGSARGADEELDEIFGQAHPNIGRVGCPPPEVLLALARRERPLGDSAYMHLGECSPCYQEVRAAQKAAAPVAQASRLATILAAAAVIILIIGAATWLLLRAPRSAPSQSVNATPAAAVLDLRPFAVQRSDQSQPAQPPLLLPRGLLHVTILLPVGSEPGAYDVNLLNASGSAQTSATGLAAIRDYVTTLATDLDLRATPPGAYRLGVRRQDEDWRFFAVQVK